LLQTSYLEAPNEFLPPYAPVSKDFTKCELTHIPLTIYPSGRVSTGP